MNRCACGSYAINPYSHRRDMSDTDLCDVCYWRVRAQAARALLSTVLYEGRIEGELRQVCDTLIERIPK